MEIFKPETRKRQPRISHSVIMVLYIRATINILDHDNGPICSGHQFFLELQIRVHAGFTRTRRAVQQVPPLPSLAYPFIILLPRNKPVQIIDQRFLHVRIHCKLIERRRMLQINGSTIELILTVRTIHAEKLHNPFVVFDLLGLIQHRRQVLAQHFLFQLLVECELEVSLLAVAIASLRLDRHQLPIETRASKSIGDNLVLLDVDAEILLARGFADLRALGGRADYGAEIGLGRVVDLVTTESAALIFYDDGHLCDRWWEEVLQGGLKK
ncbi:hypothetical protein RJ639_006785 [Escallonia herrerae]|uniref:Uncharacterized protein n=1 Tax=Escallonia herrerae TaxID=1293975 RepID=A0AA89ATZ5_9ASTE|nr:hypothetical protein RJ639_006785 [Escallonia herrerae]